MKFIIPREGKMDITVPLSLPGECTQKAYTQKTFNVYVLSSIQLKHQVFAVF